MDDFGNLLNHSHGVIQAELLKAYLSANSANSTWLLDDSLYKTAILPCWSSCFKESRDAIPLEFTFKGVWSEHTAVKLKQKGKAIQTKCQHTHKTQAEERTPKILDKQKNQWALDLILT